MTPNEAKADLAKRLNNNHIQHGTIEARKLPMSEATLVIVHNAILPANWRDTNLCKIPSPERGGYLTSFEKW